MSTHEQLLPYNEKRRCRCDRCVNPETRPDGRVFHGIALRDGHRKLTAPVHANEAGVDGATWLTFLAKGGGEKFSVDQWEAMERVQ